MKINDYQIKPVKDGDTNSLQITLNLITDDKQKDLGIVSLSVTVLMENNRDTSLGLLTERILEDVGNALLSYSESERKRNESSEK